MHTHVYTGEGYGRCGRDGAECGVASAGCGGILTFAGLGPRDCVHRRRPMGKGRGQISALRVVSVVSEVSLVSEVSVVSVVNVVSDK